MGHRGTVRIAGGPMITARGAVPQDSMRRFTAKKQYIFLLEALGQCLALWLLGPWLKGPAFFFCDNVASQFALTKGYTSDPETNTLAGLFWLSASLHGCTPWIERVPSKAQLADGPSRNVTKITADLGFKESGIDAT